MKIDKAINQVDRDENYKNINNNNNTITHALTFIRKRREVIEQIVGRNVR